MEQTGQHNKSNRAGKHPFIHSVLRRFKIKTLGIDNLNPLWRRSNGNYIRQIKAVRRTGYAASTMLLLLIALTVAPLYIHTDSGEAVGGDSGDSVITYSATSTTASTDLTVTSTAGSFATSDESNKVKFTLKTDNASGYTLNIKSSDSTTSLNNTTSSSSLSSITATKTSDNFTNNAWGIIPSKYNSTNNTTNYYPASTTGFTMDETSSANTTANSYTIGLGLKADYSKPAGEYVNTSLVAEYVANPVTYALYFYNNSSDSTISGMPTTNPTTGTVTLGTSSASVTLPAAPTRTGYAFKGWCVGASAGTNNTTNSSSVSNITTSSGIDTCSGTSYNAGDNFTISATSGSGVNYYFYAIWSVNTYTCTKQYRLENADGSWGSYTTDTTEQIKYGNTCSYSKALTNYRSSGGSNNSTASTSATMNSTDGITLMLDLYRNTYTCSNRYRLETATGTWGSYTLDGSSSVRHGGSCSYSKTLAYYKNSSSGTNDSTASTSASNVTSNQTLSLSLYRNTYTLTVNRNTTSISSVSGGGTYRWGQSASISASTASGYGFSSWTQTQYSHTPNINDAGTSSGDYANSLNLNHVVSMPGASSLHVKLTYQTESTSYDWVSFWSGDHPSYTAASNYGSGIVWTGTGSTGGKYGGTTKTTLEGDVSSSAVTFGFKSDPSVTNYGYYAVITGVFSTSSSTSITMPQSNTTVYADGYISQYTCSKRYRLQNADGSWPSSYTSDGSVTVNAGDTCSYTKTVTNYRGSSSAANGASGSTSASNVTSNTTLTLDFYRNTFTCSKRYRLENADGSWGNYTSDGSVTALYGGSCSYSKSVTNYRGSSTASNSTSGSASASNVTSAQTLSISMYRNTFTCKIGAKYQAASGSYGSASNVVNSTLRYGQTCSWSRAADSTYQAASYSATVTGNIDTTVSVNRQIYYITFDANGGSNPPDTFAFYYESGATIPTTTPTKRGYSFDYWYSPYGNLSPGGSIPTNWGSNGMTAQWKDNIGPERTNYWWGEVTANVARLYIQLWDASGVQTVQCPTVPNGQDNWNWFNASWDSSANAYRCDITPSTFGVYGATYTTHLYTWDTLSNQNAWGDLSVNIPKLYMQDLTLANCPADGATAYDKRDEQAYTVKKINDYCWMTRNLAIGCNGSGSTYGSSVSSKSLTSSNSNVSTAWSTPTALLSTEANNSSTRGYTTAAMQCSSTYGAWYNYAAATAGTITGSSNYTAATYDICPSGWHLPTGPNHTFGSQIHNLVGNVTSGWQAATTGLTAFNAVAGGDYNNGTLYATRYGFWWSATSANASGRYSLYYDSSNERFYGDRAADRYSGIFVRCVRTS